MSGSSHASRDFTRARLSLDAGISISWAPDPDTGSIEHGMEHHRREEAEFRARLDAAAPGIEVAFDELETRGHTFTPPADPGFDRDAQRHHTAGMPLLRLELCARPPLDPEALKAFGERLEALVLSPTAPAPPPNPMPPEPAPVPLAAKKPWWKFW